METNIINNLALAAIPILVAALLIWLSREWQIKSQQLNKQQYDLLRWVVSTGIWAAEQAWQAGEIDKSNRGKYVVDYCQRLAIKYHIPVDVAELSVLIQAAVAQEFNSGKIVVPKIPGLDQIIKN